MRLLPGLTLVGLLFFSSCSRDTGPCENPAVYELGTCRRYGVLAVDSAKVSEFKLDGKSIINFRDSSGNTNEWIRETDWKRFSQKDKEVFFRMGAGPCGQAYCSDKVTFREYVQIWNCASAPYRFAFYLAKDFRRHTDDSMEIVNMGDVLKIRFLDDTYWDRFSYPLANQLNELDTGALHYAYFDSLQLNGKLFYQVSRIQSSYDHDEWIEGVYCNPDLGWIAYVENNGKLWVRED